MSDKLGLKSIPDAFPLLSTQEDVQAHPLSSGADDTCRIIPRAQCADAEVKRDTPPGAGSSTESDIPSARTRLFGGVIRNHNLAINQDRINTERANQLFEQMQRDAEAYAAERLSLGLPWEAATVQVNLYDTQTFGGVTLVFANTKDRKVPVSTLWVYSPGNKDGGKTLFGSVTAHKLVEPDTALKPSVREQLTIKASAISGKGGHKSKKVITKESYIAVTPTGELVITGQDTAGTYEERHGMTGRAGIIDSSQHLTAEDLFTCREMTEGKAKALHKNWAQALAAQLEKDTKELRDGKSRGRPLADFDNEVHEGKMFKLLMTRLLRRRIASTVAAVAISLSGNLSYQHDLLEVRERLDQLLSSQVVVATGGETTRYDYDTLEANCYNSTQTQGHGITVDNGVMHVTQSTSKVSYMSANAYVQVEPDVHVDELLVCGASARAYVDKTSSVGMVAVFGSGSELDLQGSAQTVVYLDEQGQPAQSKSIRNAVVTSGGLLATRH